MFESLFMNTKFLPSQARIHLTAWRKKTKDQKQGMKQAEMLGCKKKSWAKKMGYQRGSTHVDGTNLQRVHGNRG